MSLDAQTIFSEALALPPETREELAEKLWLSLDEGRKEDIQQAWIEEIERRMEAFETGEMKARPVEEAIRSLKEKIAKK